MLFLLLTFFTHLSHAQTLKLAVLVPEGTTWGDGLKKFSQEAKAATGDRVQVKVYFGGVAGDEPDVLRKIRIGQMNGGMFTGKTLGDIHSDIRAMELPFQFHADRARAFATLQKLTPTFNQGLLAKGFVNLGFYEVGQIYVVSTKKVETLNALKGVKIWAWEGDELIKAMLEEVGLVSTPLAITDVLSSLSTGIIDAAYSSPLGIIALQWHTKVKYLIDFPTAWSLGALLVSKKEWDKIKPDDQQKLLAIGKKVADEANARTVKENETALQELKRLGIQFIKFSAADEKASSLYHNQVVKRLEGKLFSSGTYKAIGSK